MAELSASFAGGKGRSSSGCRRQLLVEDSVDVSNLFFAEASIGIKNDGDKSIGDEPSFVGPVKVARTSTTKTEEGGTPRGRRGLIATRDIAVGELLFATPPTLQASTRVVTSLWQNKQQNDQNETRTGRSLLEECSEKVLIESMHESVKMAPSNDNRRLVAASFTCLTGSTLSQDDIIPSMNRLNAIEGDADDEEKYSGTDLPPMTENDLLQIIRQNAFGPDGLCSYQNMEQALRLEKDKKSPSKLPPRLLGLYPLAAMINHSCLANAVRVFGGLDNSVMIVHSSSAIAKGEEIVWSYIPPTQPLPQRQLALQQLYKFTCYCKRCETEQKELYDSTYVANILNENEALLSPSNPNPSQCINVVEQKLMPLNFLSNTVKSFVRMSYLPMYIKRLNQEQDLRTKPALLILAMHMHLSCCTAHHASTEHISVS